MQSESPAKEALRVLEEAERRKVALRLLGGLAIYLRCPSARSPNLARSYGDVDVVGLHRESSEVRRLFTELGYAPRERFNAFQGDRRLIFDDPQTRTRVDVIQMCHTFNLSKRLELDRYTLPLSDLAITKLQIVEITLKDFKDLVSLFIDHEVGLVGGPSIDAGYIAKLCAADWGVYKTFTANLEKIKVQAGELGLTETEGKLVIDRAERLRAEIEAAKKGWRWKSRAAIGEKVRWYDLPEAT